MQFFPMTAHQFHLICFAGSNKALDIQGLLMKFISFLEQNDGTKYVRSSTFNYLKPKVGCWSLITKRWTSLSLLDVRKNNVWVYSKNDLVNLVKAFWIWCSMSVRSKPKFRWSSSIIIRWTCSSLIDVRKMMSKFQ